MGMTSPLCRPSAAADVRIMGGPLSVDAALKSVRSAERGGVSVFMGDVRGDGYFYGIELVKDKATKETFDDAEAEKLLRGFLSKALFDEGIYCRADDRGDPVVQLAPPLICDQEHFDEIEHALRVVLDKAYSLI